MDRARVFGVSTPTDTCSDASWHGIKNPVYAPFPAVKKPLKKMRYSSPRDTDFTRLGDGQGDLAQDPGTGSSKNNHKSKIRKDLLLSRVSPCYHLVPAHVPATIASSYQWPLPPGQGWAALAARKAGDGIFSLDQIRWCAFAVRLTGFGIVLVPIESEMMPIKSR